MDDRAELDASLARLIEMQIIMLEGLIKLVRRGMAGMVYISAAILMCLFWVFEPKTIEGRPPEFWFMIAFLMLAVQNWWQFSAVRLRTPRRASQDD